MAHSHHMHREHQVSHRRVHKILEEHGHDAKHHHTGPHSHAFSKVTSKTAAENHDKYACGGSSPKRYARGGKVKHGKHQTNIAIITPPHHPASGNLTPPTPAGPTGGLPPNPMAGGPPPLPMAGPGGPGGPPMMPPPGMRARGGRAGVHIDGESTSEDIKKWDKRAHANKSYARGGKLPTAGAATGVGRLESAEMMKRKK